MSEDAVPPGNDSSGDDKTTWRQSLPEDLRDHTALKDVVDVPALAKQFVDAQSYIGSAIRIPSEDAGEEDRKKFLEKLNSVPGIARIDPEDPDAVNSVLAKLGAPEKADDYELPEFEGAPEDFQPGELLNVLRDAAADSRITKAQFKKLAKKLVETDLERGRKAGEEHDNSFKELREEWGQAYDTKRAAAIKAAELTGAPEGMVEAMKNDKVRPDVVKWLSSVADRLGKEGSAGGDEDNTNKHAMTPKEAEIRLAEIMGNKDHPYYKAAPYSPERQAAVDYVLELRRLANGNDNPVVFAPGQKVIA